MPIYEYICTACGHTMEVIHGINAPGPAQCDECGGGLRKLLSPPAIVFKGSGWAKKDARSSGNGSSRAGGSKKRAAGDASPATDAPGSSPAPATSAGSATAGTTAGATGD